MIDGTTLRRDAAPARGVRPGSVEFPGPNGSSLLRTLAGFARRVKAGPLGKTRRTLAFYEAHAEAFRESTRGHDLSRGIDALLGALPADRALSILDFGCGPGRDLPQFRRRGHRVVGLDGCAAFVGMARGHAGVDVLHQDFTRLDLPPGAFDGVFANASLFHVPRRSLPRVLGDLHATIRPGGALFFASPSGPAREIWAGGRYVCMLDLKDWRALLVAAGFEEITFYRRSVDRSRGEQPWLAMVWRRH